MGRVLKLGKISSYFIKSSVRGKDSSLNVQKISPGCRFLFHTNVVKHEKESQ